METIGLIAAMVQERQALTRLVRGWRPTSLGSLRGYRFQVSGRNCILVQSGMGVQRAEAATRAILEIAKPQLLVSFGIAGAVQADLRIGDVVSAENTCLLEKGITGPLQPLTHLSQAAWNAAAQALQPHGARLISGTAITTHGFQAVDLQPEMTHPVLEMETTGILRAASERNIPLLVLRSVSDGPRAPIPINLEGVMDESYNLQIGKMLKMVLRHPRLILKSLPMVRNTQIATDHAAIALLAILKQPSPLIAE